MNSGREIGIIANMKKITNQITGRTISVMPKQIVDQVFAVVLLLHMMIWATSLGKCTSVTMLIPLNGWIT